MKKQTHKQRKILLVEDDLHLRDLYRKRFELDDFSVIEASDGKEGWEKIEGESPDLILLDLSLPKMTGIDLLKYLKHKGQSKNLPIVVLSAINENSVSKRCTDDLNVNHYFIKANIKPQQIINTIKDMLNL